MKTGIAIRWASCLVVIAGLAGSTAAVAADKACAVRTAGPGGLTGGSIGHVGPDGKCSSDKVANKPAETKAAIDEGLEASAQCRDLTFSYSRRKESACSKHGGILEWLAQK